MKRKNLIIGAIIILIFLIGAVIMYSTTKDKVPSEYTQKPFINSQAGAQKVAEDINTSVEDSLNLLNSLKNSINSAK